MVQQRRDGSKKKPESPSELYAPMIAQEYESKTLHSYELGPHFAVLSTSLVGTLSYVGNSLKPDMNWE